MAPRPREMTSWRGEKTGAVGGIRDELVNAGLARALFVGDTCRYVIDR